MDLQIVRDFLSAVSGPGTDKINSSLLGVLTLLFFGLGLGLVMGPYAGLFAKLPRPGRWGKGINQILALTLFLAGGYCGLLFAKQIGFLRDLTGPLPSRVPWRTDVDSAFAEAKAKNLPVLVDFAAEWCAACHEIDRYVFHDDKFVEKLKGFIPLRLDVTNENAENETKLKRFGVDSLPSIVFVRPSGEILKEPRINGFVPTADFVSVMDQVK